MKQITLLLFLLFSIGVFAQKITMYSNIANEISIGISSFEQTISIDWGDGVDHSIVLSRLTKDEYPGSVSGYPIGPNNPIIIKGKIRELNVESCGITNIDIRNCQYLWSLKCADNYLDSLDISQNTNLRSLYCFENSIDSLNIENKIFLRELECYSNTMRHLVIGDNENLYHLDCHDNNLTYINVANLFKKYDTNNRNYFNCSGNYIKELDLRHTRFYNESELQISYNSLLESTLFLPNSYQYETGEQRNFKFPNSWYAVQEEINLQKEYSKVDRNGETVESKFIWYRALNGGGGILLEDSLYKKEGGIFTFKYPIEDSIYCLMTNSGLGTAVYSEKIKIKNIEYKPSTASMQVSSSDTISFDVRSMKENDTITIEWGPKHVQKYAITDKVPTTIKGIAEEDGWISLKGNFINYLNVSNCSLTELNVKECPHLANLNCSNNSLKTLDISGNTSIQVLDCSNNMLQSFDFTNTQIEEAYCYSNNLSALQTANDTFLHTLNVKNNTIEELDLSQNVRLKSLNCSNNKLSMLSLETDTLLERVFVENNHLTLRSLTLPSSDFEMFDMQPQSVYELPEKIYCNTETIDLSSELYISDANNDTIKVDYVWKNSSGSTLDKNSYEEENGIFTFLHKLDDSIYCELYYQDYNFTLITQNIAVDEILSETPNVTLQTALDKNLKMEIGSSAENAMLAIDWGNNSLVYYYIDNNKIEVDGKANGVVSLYCNSLSSLNVEGQEITALNIDNAPHLEYLYCSNNNLQISTLPKHGSQLKAYTYKSQDPIAFSKDTFEITEAIHLESELTKTDSDGNAFTTTYTWKTNTGNTLTAGEDYNEENGVFSFSSSFPEGIYCVMENGALPNLSLYTQDIIIKGNADEKKDPPTTENPNNEDPDIKIKLHPSIKIARKPNEEITLQVSSRTEEEIITIVWDNDTITDTIGTAYTIFSHKACDSVTIYGNSISAFVCSGQGITELNTDSCKTLDSLDCSNNELHSLNLKSNANLQKLNCSSNKLDSLILDSIYDLAYLDCSHNTIKTLRVNMNESDSIDCSFNKLTFSTFPDFADRYSDQSDLKIPSLKNNSISIDDASINLNSEYDIFNGELNKQSNYEWFCEILQESGDTVISKLVKFAANNSDDFDYFESEGITRFSNSSNIKGSVYCEISNASYPETTIRTEKINLCDASISLSIDDGCSPYTVDSFNIETNYADSLHWYIGSEVYRTTKDSTPDYTFYNTTQTDSSVTVRLDAISKSGCQTTASAIFTLKHLPNIKIAVDSKESFTNMPITFTDTSLYGESDSPARSWLLSDNFVSNETTWKTTFPEKGVYSVSLVSEISNSCTDTAEQTITIIDEKNSNALPVITLVREFIGEISLKLCSHNEKEEIVIDWGNEKGKYTYTIGSDDITLSASAGDTIRIYGNSISAFYCSSQKITSLNIDSCTTLNNLNCSNNLLDSLSLISNTKLKKLNCSNNKLRISTIAIADTLDSAFVVSPQALYAFEKDSILVGDTLNLQSEAFIIFQEDTCYSIYTWLTANKDTLVKGSDYKEENGSFVFLQPFDSICCIISNPAMPQDTFLTEYMHVEIKQIAEFTTTADTISFKLNATRLSSPILVDWGNGSLKNYSSTTDSITGIASGSIKIFCNYALHLDLQNCEITSLEILDGTLSLNCANNKLTFATLPILKAETDYIYAPQADIKLPKDTFSINEKIDLHHGLSIRQEQTTALSFIDANNAVLKKDALYSINNTTATFKEAVNTTVQGVFTNTLFPQLFLKTSVFGVVDKTTEQESEPPSIMLVRKSEGVIRFNLRSSEPNEKITIYCDGKDEEYIISNNSEGTPIETNETDTVTIFGNNIDYIYIDGQSITNLDTRNSKTLSEIVCTNNLLDSLDVGENNNLKNLNCANNELVYLYAHDLDSVDCANNNLTIASLPANSFSYYNYSPQNLIDFSEKHLKIGDTIDLRDQLYKIDSLDNIHITEFDWYASENIQLVEGTDYTEDAGLFVFAKEFSDLIYCKMHNLALGDSLLQTSSISICNAEADFVVIDSVCENTTIAFNNKSSDASAYEWSFGDGTSDNAVNPLHIYLNETESTLNRTVVLKAISHSGCYHEKSKTIGVNKRPEVKFELLAGAPYLQEKALLKNSTATFGSPVSSYNWNFIGVDSINTYDTLIFTFSNIGIQNVGLFVELENGCSMIYSIPYDVDSIPELLLEDPEGSYRCGNDTIHLHQNSLFKKEWYKDDVLKEVCDSNIFTIINSGKYYAKLIGVDKKYMTNTIEIEQQGMNVLKINAENKSNSDTICKGHEFTLKANEVNEGTIHWWQNDTVPKEDNVSFITVKEPGKYHYIVKVGVSCEYSSDTFELSLIEEAEIPTITAEGYASDTCMGNFITLSVNVKDSFSLNWYHNDTLYAENSSQISGILNEGKYRVENDNGKCKISETVDISYKKTFYKPQIDTLIGNNCLMQCNMDATEYRWYFNDIFISGATKHQYVGRNEGAYRVAVSNDDECFSFSEPIYFIKENNPDGIYGELQDRIQMYPVPSDGNITLELYSNYFGAVSVKIFNILGIEVFNEKIDKRSTLLVYPFQIPEINEGVHFVEIFYDNKVVREEIFFE